jgi:GT2 family glycosyltransferase
MSEQAACAKEPIDLSTIIVNRNTHDLLAQCLQSVYDTVSDLDLETIVVDTASTDGSQAMVHQSFPRICLIENSENVGFA